MKIKFFVITVILTTAILCFAGAVLAQTSDNPCAGSVSEQIACLKNLSAQLNQLLSQIQQTPSANPPLLTSGCTDSDKGFDYTNFGTISDSSGNVQSDSCLNAYTLSEKYCAYNKLSPSASTSVAESKIKACPNGCKNGKCSVNLSDVASRKNTLIFAGIFSRNGNDGAITDGYAAKISNNINGLATCCNVQTMNSHIVSDYHTRGFIISTHVQASKDAIQAAKDGLDIITLDEFKWRKVAFTGGDFNKLKAQINLVNPNAKLGIVEADINDYNSWASEGAKPDFVGLEQYITTSGVSTGGYASYADFSNLVNSKWPGIKKQVWINNVSQISQFLGKADYIILFAVDSDTLGSFGSNWPSFRLSNIENTIKNTYGTIPQDVISLKAFSAPSSAVLGSTYQVGCDFGNKLGYMQAYSNGVACAWANKWDGTTGFFNCKAKTAGVVENACDLLNNASIAGSFAQHNKISSTNVTAKTGMINLRNAAASIRDAMLNVIDIFKLFFGEKVSAQSTNTVSLSACVASPTVSCLTSWLNKINDLIIQLQNQQQITSEQGDTSVLPSITLTSPNGGENWKIGTTHNITWTSNNVALVYPYWYGYNSSGSVVNSYPLFVINNGNAIGIPASNGSFSWTIPQSLSANSSLAMSKIYITSSTAGGVSDKSDNYFVISPATTSYANNSDALASISATLAQIMQELQQLGK